MHMICAYEVVHFWLVSEPLFYSVHDYNNSVLMKRGKNVILRKHDYYYRASCYLKTYIFINNELINLS